MPTRRVEPALFLSHRDVEAHHVYNDDSPLSYWYTFDQSQDELMAGTTNRFFNSISDVLAGRAHMPRSCENISTSFWNTPRSRRRSSPGTMTPMEMIYHWQKISGPICPSTAANARGSQDG